jgi:hypothetical protein
MKKTARLAAVLLVGVPLILTGCGPLSCAESSSPETTVSTADTTVSTSSTTAAVSTTTTAPPATAAPTTTAPTTTTVRPTTTTTLSALGAYRVAMRTWKNAHAAELEAGYTAMTHLGDPNHPTPAEIQAARDLDTAMTAMIADLAAIQAPSVLAGAHAGYLASLTKMGAGVHDLALALEEGKALRAYAAMTAIAVAWGEGAPYRATLEAALGFSISGA